MTPTSLEIEIRHFRGKKARIDNFQKITIFLVTIFFLEIPKNQNWRNISLQSMPTFVQSEAAKWWKFRTNNLTFKQINLEIENTTVVQVVLFDK